MNEEEYCDLYICKHCGSGRQKRIFGPHPGNHYARIDCIDCGRYLRWEPKRTNEGKPSSRKNQSKLLAKFSRGFCEICLRLSDELPVPQVLEAHHIIPVEDGGTDDRDNIQIVCTPCHKWIHHQRTYLGHYRRSIPQAQVDERYRLYEEIIQVMKTKGIKKRDAIGILNEKFNAQTRDDLTDAQLKEFLAALNNLPMGETA